jgi:3-(3-hydroxy-phenyl)propionate hydroxylase
VRAKPGKEYDVAIVGAGPVGLMTANLLGSGGLRVGLFERNGGLVGLPRAIAYDAETLRLFAQVGLFDEIAPGLVQDPGVRYLNARGGTLMAAQFPRSLYGHSRLGTFYQPHFEQALLKGLSRFVNVSIAFGHSVGALEQDEHGVTMTISTPDGERKIRTAFLVACDGGTSDIRERLGVKLLGSTYAERWLVVDAIVRNHDVRNITFTCDPRRPNVELPAVGERVRWEFMQMPGESEDALKRDDTVHALIRRKAGIDAFEIERKTVYTFHARVADRWRVGRVFLAGDAAHLMPPFAGQGMNAGMKDAVNLSWKLVAVVSGQAPADILDSYEAERMVVVRKMVDLSRRLGSLIMPTSPILAASRDALFACLNLSGRFRAFIARGAFVPPPAIHPSALTANGEDALIGQMAPQPTVRNEQGETQLDQLLGCHQWLALGIETDPVPNLSERDLAILDALGARFVCINAAAESRRTSSLRCEDSRFMAWADDRGVRGVLIRPDRFIAARLNAGADLRVLDSFVVAAQAPLPRAA